MSALSLDASSDCAHHTRLVYLVYRAFSISRPIATKVGETIQCIRGCQAHTFRTFSAIYAGSHKMEVDGNELNKHARVTGNRRKCVSMCVGHEATRVAVKTSHQSRTCWAAIKRSACRCRMIVAMCY